MSDIIPADKHRAAVRASIRTTAQSLGGTLAAAAGAVALTDVTWWQGLLGSGAASVIAGASAYLLMVARGIPSDYQPTTITSLDE